MELSTRTYAVGDDLFVATGKSVGPSVLLASVENRNDVYDVAAGAASRRCSLQDGLLRCCLAVVRVVHIASDGSTHE